MVGGGRRGEKKNKMKEHRKRTCWNVVHMCFLGDVMPFETIIGLKE